MDISKIMNIFGLDDDKPEELEVAMEKQILPDIHPGKINSGRDLSPNGAESPRRDELRDPDAALPEHGQLITVGRCPSCGDLMMAKAVQPCAWCDTPCRPEQDGFHLVHIALGSFQERHCFCCDDCFEAFRRMYPARVHRNCYERPCADCNYCIKRYTEESDGFPRLESTSRTPVAVTPEKA